MRCAEPVEPDEDENEVVDLPNGYEPEPLRVRTVRRKMKRMQLSKAQDVEMAEGGERAELLVPKVEPIIIRLGNGESSSPSIVRNGERGTVWSSLKKKISSSFHRIHPIRNTGEVNNGNKEPIVITLEDDDDDDKEEKGEEVKNTGIVTGEGELGEEVTPFDEDADDDGVPASAQISAEMADRVLDCDSEDIDLELPASHSPCEPADQGEEEELTSASKEQGPIEVEMGSDPAEASSSGTAATYTPTAPLNPTAEQRGGGADDDNDGHECVILDDYPDRVWPQPKPLPDFIEEGVVVKHGNEVKVEVDKEERHSSRTPPSPSSSSLLDQHPKTTQSGGIIMEEMEASPPSSTAAPTQLIEAEGCGVEEDGNGEEAEARPTVETPMPIRHSTTSGDGEMDGLHSEGKESNSGSELELLSESGEECSELDAAIEAERRANAAARETRRLQRQQQQQQQQEQASSSSPSPTGRSKSNAPLGVPRATRAKKPWPMPIQLPKVEVEEVSEVATSTALMAVVNLTTEPLLPNSTSTTLPVVRGDAAGTPTVAAAASLMVEDVMRAAKLVVVPQSDASSTCSNDCGIPRLTIDEPLAEGTSPWFASAATEQPQSRGPFHTHLDSITPSQQDHNNSAADLLASEVANAVANVDLNIVDMERPTGCSPSKGQLQENNPRGNSSPPATAEAAEDDMEIEVLEEHPPQSSSSQFGGGFTLPSKSRTGWPLPTPPPRAVFSQFTTAATNSPGSSNSTAATSRTEYTWDKAVELGPSPRINLRPEHMALSSPIKTPPVQGSATAEGGDGFISLSTSSGLPPASNSSRPIPSRASSRPPPLFTTTVCGPVIPPGMHSRIPPPPLRPPVPPLGGFPPGAHPHMPQGLNPVAFEQNFAAVQSIWPMPLRWPNNAGTMRGGAAGGSPHQLPPWLSFPRHNGSFPPSLPPLPPPGLVIPPPPSTFHSGGRDGGGAASLDDNAVAQQLQTGAARNLLAKGKERARRALTPVGPRQTMGQVDASRQRRSRSVAPGDFPSRWDGEEGRRGRFNGAARGVVRFQDEEDAAQAAFKELPDYTEGLLDDGGGCSDGGVLRRSRSHSRHRSRSRCRHYRSPAARFPISPIYDSQDDEEGSHGRRREASQSPSRPRKSVRSRAATPAARRREGAGGRPTDCSTGANGVPIGDHPPFVSPPSSTCSTHFSNNPHPPVGNPAYMRNLKRFGGLSLENTGGSRNPFTTPVGGVGGQAPSSASSRQGQPDSYYFESPLQQQQQPFPPGVASHSAMFRYQNLPQVPQPMECDVGGGGGSDPGERRPPYNCHHHSTTSSGNTTRQHRGSSRERNSRHCGSNAAPRRRSPSPTPLRHGGYGDGGRGRGEERRSRRDTSPRRAPTRREGARNNSSGTNEKAAAATKEPRSSGGERARGDRWDDRHGCDSKTSHHRRCEKDRRGKSPSSSSRHDASPQRNRRRRRHTSSRHHRRSGSSREKNHKKSSGGSRRILKASRKTSAKEEDDSTSTMTESRGTSSRSSSLSSTASSDPHLASAPSSSSVARKRQKLEADMLRLQILQKRMELEKIERQLKRKGKEKSTTRATKESKRRRVDDRDVRSGEASSTAGNLIPPPPSPPPSRPTPAKRRSTGERVGMLPSNSLSSATAGDRTQMPVVVIKLEDDSDGDEAAAAATQVINGQVLQSSVPSSSSTCQAVPNQEREVVADELDPDLERTLAAVKVFDSSNAEFMRSLALQMNGIEKYTGGGCALIPNNNNNNSSSPSAEDGGGEQGEGVQQSQAGISSNGVGETDEIMVLEPPVAPNTNHESDGEGGGSQKL